jgi:hypothetical protein
LQQLNASHNSDGPYVNEDFVELGLNASHRKVLFVFGSIDGVEWSPAIKDVVPLGSPEQTPLFSTEVEFAQVNQVI